MIPGFYLLTILSFFLLFFSFFFFLLNNKKQDKKKGNTTSQQQEKEEETIKIINKVPKHLQPLKRKHTKRRNNSSTTIVQNKPPKEQDNNKTFKQPIEFNPTIINQLSSSSPQLFRWTKGRRFHNNDVRTSIPDVNGIHIYFTETLLIRSMYIGYYIPSTK